MNNFYKGILAGIFVGATVSMFKSPTDRKKIRAAKKTVGRAIRTVGHVINDISM